MNSQKGKTRAEKTLPPDEMAKKILKVFEKFTPMPGQVLAIQSIFITLKKYTRDSIGQGLDKLIKDKRIQPSQQDGFLTLKKWKEDTLYR